MNIKTFTRGFAANIPNQGSPPWRNILFGSLAALFFGGTIFLGAAFAAAILDYSRLANIFLGLYGYGATAVIILAAGILLVAYAHDIKEQAICWFWVLAVMLLPNRD